MFEHDYTRRFHYSDSFTVLRIIVNGTAIEIRLIMMCCIGNVNYINMLPSVT